MLKVVYIEAHDLGDAWFQCIWNVLDKGHRYTIDKGSFKGQERLEFDYVTVSIKNPGNRPIIPLMPEGSGLPAPADMNYVENYLNYLLTPQKTEKEDYTYGERMHDPKARLEEKLDVKRIKEKTGIDLLSLTDEQILELYPRTKKIERVNGLKLFREIPFGVNPFQQAINDYKEKGFGTNQETLEIAMPSDIILDDPPCLRILDSRVRYGKLHFMLYFRSWDLWSGFPVNLAGLQLVKEFMADEIGVEDGEMIVSSKGLHLYDYVYELAELRTNKKIETKDI